MSGEPIFVVREYLDAEEKKLSRLRSELADITDEKNDAYQSDTNSWHDNFAFENAARMAATLKTEIAELSESLKMMSVCPNENDGEPQMVELWTRARVLEENPETGESAEKTICITPIGGEDVKNAIYHYRMPLIAPLMNAKVGDGRIANIPSGKVKFTVLEITRM
jgi:transcription elongation GreA/GreB family factor